jgi:hypothetical protein
MAIKVIASELFQKVFKQVGPIFGIESGILVNIEEVEKGRFDPDETTDRPIIFFCFRPESLLRRQNHPAVQYFYRKDCAYFQLPGELVEMKILHDQLVDGKKPENKAAILVSNLNYKKNSISIILHDLKYYPGEVGQRAMKRAETEFDLVGSLDEVQKMLEEYRKDCSSGKIKNLAGEDIIPGIFCDVEGTLVYEGIVNQTIVDKLEKLSKTKAVSIWTGGETKEAEKMLYNLGVNKWPVLSKYDFAGCRVETIFDDLPKKKFEEDYDIHTSDYRKVKMGRL